MRPWIDRLLQYVWPQTLHEPYEQKVIWSPPIGLIHAEHCRQHPGTRATYRAQRRTAPPRWYIVSGDHPRPASCVIARTGQIEHGARQNFQVALRPVLLRETEYFQALYAQFAAILLKFVDFVISERWTLTHK